MKKTIRFIRNRPSETKCTVIGATIGAGTGYIIGGAGLAVLGTAFPVSMIAVLGVSCGLVGNRIGIAKDRPVDPKS